jgi:uncharacterized membrane protein
MKRPSNPKLLQYTFVLSLITVLILLFFSNYLAGGYPKEWSDNFGHLFKVWKIWKFGFVNYASEWYGGYPFERFYPPLAYLFGASYASLVNSDVLGYKLVTLSSMLLSLATTYFATQKVGMKFYQSTIAAVFYTFSIWNMMTPLDGGFSRYLAAGLAPLLPLAFLSIFDFTAGKKIHVAAGLLVGAMIITHHTFLVTTTYAGFFVAAALLVLKIKKPQLSPTTVKKVLVNLGIVGVVAFAVSAFWVIPFASDIGSASFVAENTIPELYSFQSNSVTYILTVNAPYLKGTFDFLVSSQSISYHLLVVLAPLVALGARNRRAMVATSILAVSYWIAVGLSLGANGPLWSLNRLPLMTMVPPNRWMDAIPLMAAFQTAFVVKIFYDGFVKSRARMVRYVPVFWAVVLLLPTIAIVPYASYYTPYHLPDDFMQTMNFIKANTQPEERYYQYGLITTTIGPVGPIIGYSPALTNAATVDGWYRQGDPSDRFKKDLYWSTTEAPQRAAELLEAYNVKHVILNLGHPTYDKAYQALTSIGYKESFALNSYRVMSTDKTDFATPSARVLAVGDEWIIRSSLESSTLQVTYVGNKIPDNFSETTSQYDLVVLQAYNYENQNWTSSLKSYIEQGGIVVVDPYKSPDQNSDNLLGLGVKASAVEVKGFLVSTEFVSGASWNSTYSWEGESWGGCSFQGSGIAEALRIGSYVGVGTAQIGRGYVVLVGLNLMFHGLYTQDTRNINSLEETIHNILTNTTQIAVQSEHDGNVRLLYSSTRPSTVRVSETWFPHWEILIDGTYFGAPSKDPVSGIMTFQLPQGQHTIDLIFNDPYGFLRFVSVFSALLAIVLVLVPIKRLGRAAKKLGFSFSKSERLNAKLQFTQ